VKSSETEAERGGFSMRFYLGVRNGLTAISDDEAAARYLVLSDEKSSQREFDAQVYAFYRRLTELYPEVDMLPEDQLGSSPWACSIEMSGGHVIMAIQLENHEKIAAEIMALAGQHELVCFDPQAGRVYLPPRLKVGQADRGGRSA